MLFSHMFFEIGLSQKLQCKSSGCDHLDIFLECFHINPFTGILEELNKQSTNTKKPHDLTNIYIIKQKSGDINEKNHLKHMYKTILTWI